MNKVEGKVTEETILRQCINMSKNERLAAFMWYFGSTNALDVRVHLDATYNEGLSHNAIYRSAGLHAPKTLAEILSDLIKIEHEYAGDNKNE